LSGGVNGGGASSAVLGIKVLLFRAAQNVVCAMQLALAMVFIFAGGMTRAAPMEMLHLAAEPSARGA